MTPDLKFTAHASLPHELPSQFQSDFAAPVRVRSLHQTGFTLIEMLVVLLIVAMAGGLVFEGGAQVMGMQARLEGQLSQLRGLSLRADWIRQLVQGLQPDFQDGAQIFKGSPHGFSGLSTNPLSGDYGGIEPFTLSLEQDRIHGEMTLRYGTKPDAPAILHWQGDRGGFHYLDDKGEAHEDWPPPLGLWPQLPSAITLEGGGDVTWLIVATPAGPRWPSPRPSDMMAGVP